MYTSCVELRLGLKTATTSKMLALQLLINALLVYTYNLISPIRMVPIVTTRCCEPYSCIIVRPIHPSALVREDGVRLRPRRSNDGLECICFLYREIIINLLSFCFVSCL